MIRMTWMSAPAGSFGPGSADVRPGHRSGLGTGLPTGTVTRTAACPAVLPLHAVHGTAVFAVRLRPDTRQQVARDGMTEQTFQNFGTTLGIHSSGRPQS
jgi:hypothetical protein